MEKIRNNPPEKFRIPAYEPVFVGEGTPPGDFWEAIYGERETLLSVEFPHASQAMDAAEVTLYVISDRHVCAVSLCGIRRTPDSEGAAKFTLGELRQAGRVVEGPFSANCLVEFGPRA